MERHFSTSDAVDAGEGGGESNWLESASLTPWMASIFTDFIPCKAFKRVRGRAQKRRSLDGKQKQVAASEWMRAFPSL